MIGSVEAGAFENDSYRRVDLAQSLLAALWATGQRSFAKFLIAVKTNAAVFALVRIGGHPTPQSLWKSGLLSLPASHYSAPAIAMQDLLR